MNRLMLLLPVLLGGCIASPSADVLKALAGDPNSICWVITTPWGGQSFDRNHGCGQAPAPAPAMVLPTIELNPNGTVRSFGFTH